MGMLRQDGRADELCGPGGAGQEAADRQGATIFAPASGHGVAGVAVIRISGALADQCLAELTLRELPAPRQLALRRLLDRDGSLLDEALVVRFEAGSSYTGEAVVELHCHGSVAVVDRVLQWLGETEGCRLALPGEFTRRALEAGRVDLAEVEALGDLLAAETEAQRRQAMRGYGGALHRRVEEWRTALVRALALVEVTIDWADEEVPEDVGPEVGELVAAVRAGMAAELAGAGAAERLRSGFEVALLGAPNAGKSSLFNALADREAAITSPEPGTTRDVIELRYDLEGLPVIFLDTAGLREARDSIEAAGVARAKDRAEAAALRIFLDAPDAPLAGVADDLIEEGDLVLRSKADLGSGGGDVSAATGAGIERLLGEVRDRLARRAGEAGLVGRMRQREALDAAATALDAAGQGDAAEVLSERLRHALAALDGLTGRNRVEDVLHEVFSSYCLGK